MEQLVDVHVPLRDVYASHVKSLKEYFMDSRLDSALGTLSGTVLPSRETTRPYMVAGKGTIVILGASL